MEKKHVTKKNAMSKVAKEKERRISNKKIERLSKYWDVFPELKKSLFIPVDGQDYSIIKPKNVEDAIIKSKEIKKLRKTAMDLNKRYRDILYSEMVEHANDVDLDKLRQRVKREFKEAFKDIPLISPRTIGELVDKEWIFVEQTVNAIKTSGMMSVKDQFHFQYIMKHHIALELALEDYSLGCLSYSFQLTLDYINERNKNSKHTSKSQKSIDKLMKAIKENEEDIRTCAEKIEAELQKRLEKVTEEDIISDIQMIIVEIALIPHAQVFSLIHDISSKIK